jgi:glycosyltransferase involved in cell wall biosynthesis
MAEGLASRGHQVTVVTSQHSPDLPREEDHCGVRIVRVPAVARLSRGQVMPAFPAVVNRLAREHDVVQVHTPMLETWLVGILAHRHRNKMVMTHHGDLVMPAGLWNGVVQRTVGYLLDRGADVADVITIHSQDYADHSPYLNPHAHKVTAIYPPVEIPEPDPVGVAKWRAELGLTDRKLVGFAGRFVEEKGFDYLLKAIPWVVEEMPEVMFAYAGEHRVAYEDFYGQWRRLIDANAEHLLMLGLITDRQRLADYYAMCDVFALPSRTDCFPSVQIEALLCGTPLVTTDIPGAREVVQLTGMGLLVEPRNERAIAEGLLTVLRDPEAYTKSRLEIRAVFDTEQTVGQYERLFQSLLDGQI